MSDPLRVFVCVKQVLDPEAPSATLRVDPEGLAVSASGTPPVLNPYDENALKAALDLREQGEVDITVLSVHPGPAKNVLSKTLAAGADRILALKIPGDAGWFTRGAGTARLLAALVGEAGPFDLILAGRQASDTNAGVVGPLLAGLLGVSLVTLACGLRRGNPGELLVERLIENGRETLGCPLPALITVGSEIGELPLPSARDRVAAKSRPLRLVEPAELGVPDAPDGLGLVALSKPAIERRCELISAADARAAGAALAARISGAAPRA